ncbi:GNAT family N-acetyltransferase [Mangrovibacter yixingensis]|uniref:GNAT family N-acetyltransferase n=1 Tax=Mangrovibacter yixingensis TaxID=1529639 RepID=UPI001CFBA8AE|nr:GNAT family N-acetyltransferase [Mangrovibacter yixingensis]
MARAEITGAEKADLPVLCQLFNHARETSAVFIKKHHTDSEFARLIAGEQVVVARLSGSVAGFAAVWLPDTFLHHLYVAPACQHRGVGTALLEHCLQEVGETLSLKCLVANISACQFYEKRGFVQQGKGVSPEGRYILYARTPFAAIRGLRG